MRADENSILKVAIERYNKALTTIETANNPSQSEILELLKARDEIHILISDKTQNYQSSHLIELFILDERLKKQTEVITTSVQLSDWRVSLCPSTDAWWWLLEPPPHKHDRRDWVYSAGSIICLTASVSLVVDISSRILTGVPDTFGAFTITTQSILTLIAAGGALTKAGQEAVERILIRLKIPKHFQVEFKFGIAALLFLSLIVFRVSLPTIGHYYRGEADEQRGKRNLAKAQIYYNRAIKLNSEDWSSHYKLGQIYEKLQDFERARTEYSLAMQGDYINAYNSLSRLYILDKDYDKAIGLLDEALNRKIEDRDLKYALNKNLGWAYLEQKRYLEAERYLNEAIAIDKQRASPYCLMGQVKEYQANEKSTDKSINSIKKDGTTGYWHHSCIKYRDESNSSKLDAERWKFLAEKCLNWLRLKKLGCLSKEEEKK
ncbi:tetratricopeptide repeat protein [Anabaena catenula]|uniref:Tetratricopeptide repeat protein n=1 Tax=Anabaena catenula FACHB-362 TaxID=2692877 RepID=A0ABR8JC11_9NOST|nr:tetratricopeptide repeat protein [Anabaena catenula]MBD2694546.1 tetratricopeptide repeat protein [Anabaena catenula FACHB-362]